MSCPGGLEAGENKTAKNYDPVLAPLPSSLPPQRVFVGNKTDEGYKLEASYEPSLSFESTACRNGAEDGILHKQASSITELESRLAALAGKMDNRFAEAHDAILAISARLDSTAAQTLETGTYGGSFADHSKVNPSTQDAERIFARLDALDDKVYTLAGGANEKVNDVSLDVASQILNCCTNKIEEMSASFAALVQSEVRNVVTHSSDALSARFSEQISSESKM